MIFFLFFFLFMFLSLFFSFLLFLFSFFFCLQYVNFPNANLLVFLFPGFIVIPKPSQLSQWNSSIATIFLLLKKPCNPESDAALHPASIASFPLLWYPSPLSPSPPRPAPPCLALTWSFLLFFPSVFWRLFCSLRFSLTRPSGGMKQKQVWRDCDLFFLRSCTTALWSFNTF